MKKKTLLTPTTRVDSRGPSAAKMLVNVSNGEKITKFNGKPLDPHQFTAWIMNTAF
jgi:hypothetical protein